jgi:tRNA pseudouridine38-40 synthase
MRVRATVAYDGTDYHGFQRQAPDHKPSIQGTLERALASIGQENITVVGSGRTDAGVHASGQVIAFDVEWRHGLPALQRALNATLPPAIAVLDLDLAAPDFHPRYDALSRQYVYTIYNAPVRHPLYARFSWHVPNGLNVAQMDRACQYLIGEHDFAAFGQPHKPGESTIRRVYQTGCRRDGNHVRVDVEASGFLYRMMRSLVGTLAAVGCGKLEARAVAGILGSRDRSQAEPTAPPHGLCLAQVKY